MLQAGHLLEEDVSAPVASNSVEFAKEPIKGSRNGTFPRRPFAVVGRSFLFRYVKSAAAVVPWSEPRRRIPQRFPVDCKGVHPISSLRRLVFKGAELSPRAAIMVPFENRWVYTKRPAVGRDRPSGSSPSDRQPASELSLPIQNFI